MSTQKKKKEEKKLSKSKFKCKQNLLKTKKKYEIKKSKFAHNLNKNY